MLFLGGLPRIKGRPKPQLEDLRGLSKRAPALALVLAVGAVALVGLPPTAGFMGKFFLLAAAWNRGFNWLVVIAAANVAVAPFLLFEPGAVCLRLGKLRSFLENEGGGGMSSRLSLLGGLFLAGLVILFGILPDLVFRMMMS